MTTSYQQFEMEFNKFFNANTFAKLRNMLYSKQAEYCIYSEDDANEVIEESIIELYDQIVKQWDEKDYHTQLTYGMISIICRRHAAKRATNKWVVNTKSFDDLSATDEKGAPKNKVDQVYFALTHNSYRAADEYKYTIAQECLNELNGKKKALLIGFYIDKKSFEQLSEELGYSSAAVAKTTKCRILADLNAKFQKRIEAYRKSHRFDVFGRCLGSAA